MYASLPSISYFKVHQILYTQYRYFIYTRHQDTRITYYPYHILTVPNYFIHQTSLACCCTEGWCKVNVQSQLFSVVLWRLWLQYMLMSAVKRWVSLLLSVITDFLNSCNLSGMYFACVCVVLDIHMLVQAFQ